MTDAIAVVTTLERREDADSLARALVERRLAGCVQVVGPIHSTYRWQEAIETAEEWLCVVKTLSDCYDRVEQAIRELHPYDVPEILTFAAEGGSAEYLGWLRDQVGPADPDDPIAG